MRKNILYATILLSAVISTWIVSLDQPLAIGQSNTTNTTNSNITDNNNTTISPIGSSNSVGSTLECDPSYPDTCISPYPPDLNCDDVSSKNFAVTSPDPHGFDRDSDGIGCES